MYTSKAVIDASLISRSNLEPIVLSLRRLSTMASKFKVLIFDLGGVLLEWDRQSVNAVSPGQFLTIMNSTTWHSLDRGSVTLKEACKVNYFVSLDPQKSTSSTKT